MGLVFVLMFGELRFLHHNNLSWVSVDKQHHLNCHQSCCTVLYPAKRKDLYFKKYTVISSIGRLMAFSFVFTK